VATRSLRKPVRQLATVLAWAVVAGSGSCYDHTPPVPDDIAVLTLPATVVADGASVETIGVKVDPATPNSTAITITVSTGVVNFAASPTDSSARQISLKNDGTGQLSTPWMVGTRAGEAVVTLAVGGATRMQTITLTASAPASLTLGLDTTALKLDGAAHAQATVFLSTSDPTKSVSDGTVVYLGFCCPNQAGSNAATTCAAPPPVTVPARVMASGATATATVSTEAVPALAADAGVPMPTLVYLIATTASPLSCAPPSGGMPQDWASAAITLTPPKAN
jgi:hypothetical protein